MSKYILDRGFKGTATLFTAVLLLGSSSVLAQTLKEAVQQAVTDYPTVQQGRHESQAIEADLANGRSRYWPSVDLELAHGRERSDNPTTRANGYDDRWLTRTERKLTVVETIFDGFDREADIDEQKALLRGAGYHIRDVAETLAADVAFAYINVLRHEEILRLSRNNLSVHKKILSSVRERVDAGQSGVGDLEQAKTRLAEAEARIAEIKTDLDQARISFNRIVGHMPESLVMPKFNNGLLPASVDAAVATANDKNPVIHRASAQMDASKERIRAARSEMYPSLYLELAATDNDNIDGVRGENSDLSAMLRLKWNLFRGGSDHYAGKAAAQRHSKSMHVVAQVRREVEEAVRRAWSSVKHQDEEVVSRQSQVQSNRQVVDVYREEFNVGQRDLLDLLDSENELFIARSKLTSAQSSALYARYLLLASIGLMTETMEIEFPPEATVAAD
jgi:adhesin transport system outer membrane protein